MCEDPGGGGITTTPRPSYKKERKHRMPQAPHGEEDGRVPATEHTEEAGHRIPNHDE